MVYTNLKSGLRAGADLHLLPEILPATAPGGEPPGLIGICEARWWQHGGQSAAEAERYLKKVYGCEYRLKIGGIGRSDDPPALAWRTDTFTWHGWNTPANDHHRYSHNTGLLAWADAPERVAVRVQVVHLDYASVDQRSIEAQTIAAQFDPDLANIVMGDFNSAPSGAHGGDRDWDTVPAHKRRHKARLVERSPGQWGWVKDTVPLDTLIGPWDEHAQQRRTDLGAGYRTLAEIDWEQRGRPGGGLAGTTVNAQSLPIDHILVDESTGLVPGSFTVHLNPHSDHGVLHAQTLVHPGRQPGEQ
ncbi:endonuclease/exonuclease/phosphatase family protein [Nocardiopsis terrae]|uniref:endonuclease/exonuclease/phosphatase family protein n=1 Tax=Streptomyces sp. NPDC057554 TaxID=3350538 RepID=UPI0036B546AC